MRKTTLKLKAYSIISDKLEDGLGFALNRFEDILLIDITDDQRRRVIGPMMNELMIALDDVIDWDLSG